MHRRLAFLVLAAWGVWSTGGTLARADAPDPAVATATTLGAVGVPEVVSAVMERQAQRDAAGRVERDQEEEIEQPDRSGLPLNPESPIVAQFPELPPDFKPQVGEIQTLSPQTVGTNFTGATLAGVNPTFSFPPDSMGAVGLAQYIVFVNGRIVTFNKVTGIADGVLNADPDVFFNSVRNGSSTSDPRIRYDRLTARWFLTIINVSTPNRILIAVSDAASTGIITPSTVFTFFFIDIAATPPAISNTCLADYPTLGIDANALYIGTNNFCGSPLLSFNSTDGYVIRKSSILGAGPMVVTALRGLVANASAAGPYTPQGVDNFDPAATEGYFIGVDNATFGTLMMRRVATPGGTPTVSGNIPITVAATAFPLRVPHLGNTGGNNGQLSALDDRLFAAHIRNGRLWTAHNIGVNNTGVSSGTITRDGSRWYELNVPLGSGTPTIVQSGTVFTPSGTNINDQRYYWIPSVMVSGQGHAALGFSTAGANERANAATVGRLGTDALGTMQTPVLFTSSSTAYNPASDPGGSNGRRWGDYTYTSLDPQDDQTMWTLQQFCDAANSYGVRVAKLIAPSPALPSVLPDIDAGQNPVLVTLTGVSAGGSGYYDPGADLAGVPPFNHLAVAIGNGAAAGTPPSVVAATYVNPTTVDLVLNAAAATPNVGSERYTLTVTNPDGQTAAAAVVRVVGTTPVVTLATGPSAAEGNAGAANLDFTVSLSAAATADVAVFYQTADGTATTADGDYQSATDSILIPTGVASGVISVPVNGDEKFESDETFTLTITAATNATLGAPIAATGGITNDDQPPSVTVDSIALAEGDSGTQAFGFTVSLSQASGVAAAVDVATADGTATLADNDYQSTSVTVDFAPGEVSRPVTVLVNGDTTQEPDETFTVGLSNLVALQPGTLTGTGTILNDEAAPVVSIDSVSSPEGNAGTTALAFTVSLSHATTETVTVQFQTTDGSATLADGDYQAAGGTATLLPGLLSVPIDVLLNGDLCGEADETFAVTLSDPTHATLGAAAGTGTIQNDDDDVAPSVTVIAPNGGETLLEGTLTDIQWSATDAGGVVGVDILLSRDGGVTFPEVLASGIANSGTLAWNVTGPFTPAADAFVRVVAHDAGCNAGTDASDAGCLIANAVTAAPGEGPIVDFALGLPRPNPTNGATEIGFALPRTAAARISVFDVRGREVTVLLERTLSAGRYVAIWTGQTAEGPAARGVYFIRLEADGRQLHRRLVLMR